MNEQSSNRTIVLWQDMNGQPTADWRWGNIPRIENSIGENGHLAPFPFKYVVRAPNTDEACQFVRESATSLSNDDRTGISWTRGESDGPPPLSADTTEYWTCTSYCGSVRLEMFAEKADAFDTLIDLNGHGCEDSKEGGFYWPCVGPHVLERMTRDEALERKSWERSVIPVLEKRGGSSQE